MPKNKALEEIQVYDEGSVLKFHCSSGHLVGDSNQAEVRCTAVQLPDGSTDYRWKFIDQPLARGCTKGQLLLKNASDLEFDFKAEWCEKP